MTAPDEVSLPGRIPRAADPFGEAVMRCHAAGDRPGTSFVIYEWQDGLIQVEDAAKYFADPAQWNSLDRQACALATGRVLDIGCGPGRHALVLQQAGHEVVAVDVSPGAVAVARSRGVDARIAAVPNLPTDLGRFDTLLMLGNNFAMLAGREQTHEVLMNLAALAAPGAIVLGRTSSPRADFDVTSRTTQDTAGARGPAQTRAKVRIRHEFAIGDWHDRVFSSAEEVADAVAGSPWILRKVAHDGSSYLVELHLNPASPRPATVGSESERNG
jgi:SAM-dependent methyltransferase